jgi:hypothetical protein
MTLESFMVIVRLQMSVFAIGTILSFTNYKTKDLYIKILGFALLCSVVGDLSADVLRAFKINPNYGSSVYHLISFPLISLIYFYALGKRGKNVFLIINICFFIFGMVNMISYQESSINTYTLILESILVIIFSLYYFYWLLRVLPTSQLQRLPMFWLNSAHIIYFSGNLFLFVFTSYLVNVLNNNLLVYWTIHNILGIIEGFMIIVALWLDLRNIKSPS